MNDSLWDERRQGGFGRLRLVRPGVGRLAGGLLSVITTTIALNLGLFLVPAWAKAGLAESGGLYAQGRSPAPNANPAPSPGPSSVPSPAPTSTGTPVELIPIQPRSRPNPSASPIASPRPSPSPSPIAAPRPSPSSSPVAQRNQPRTLAERLAARISELKRSGDRWIQIDLHRQRLFAWEGDQNVYAIVISTGKDGTPTYPGIFRIQRKLESDRMRGEGYDVPNVPYVMYYDRGFAIHGAYWHNNFGRRVSHGCTNVAPDHARWLFDWADVGTPIVIRP